MVTSAQTTVTASAAVSLKTEFICRITILLVSLLRISIPMDTLVKAIVPSIVQTITDLRNGDPELKDSKIRISKETIETLLDENEELKEVMAEEMNKFALVVREKQPDISDEMISLFYHDILIKVFMEAQDEVLAKS